MFPTQASPQKTGRATMPGASTDTAETAVVVMAAVAVVVMPAAAAAEVATEGISTADGSIGARPRLPMLYSREEDHPRSAH